MSEFLKTKLADAITELSCQFDALYSHDEHTAIRLTANIVNHLRVSAERTAINDDIRENFNMGFLSKEELQNALIK